MQGPCSSDKVVLTVYLQLGEGVKKRDANPE